MSVHDHTGAMKNAIILRAASMRHLVLVVFAVLALPICAQYRINIDSLEHVFRTERNALKRLESAWWLSRSPDLDIAERYAPQVIRLADSLLAHGRSGDYEILTKKGSGLWNWGRAHFGPDQVDSTMAWFQRALDLWTAIGNKERIVFANSQMAPKLMDQGRIEEGMRMLENGLKVNEAIGNTFFIATNHNGLGSAYLGLGDYARAIDHYNASITLLRTMDDENGYRYLGDALADMGLIHADLQQPDSAVRYYEEAAVAYRKGKVPGRAIVPLLDLGTILRKRGSEGAWREALREVRSLDGPDVAPGDRCMLYTTLADEFRAAQQMDSALHYDRSAMVMAEESKFLDRRALTACSMARTLMALGRWNEALTVLTSLEKGPDGGNLSLRSRMDMAGLRYEIHEHLGRQVEALAAHLEFVLYRDSLRSEDGRRKLIYMDLKKQQATDSLHAEQDRRDMEVAHARELVAEQGRKRMVMFGGLGVLVLAGGLWNRLRYTRRAKRAIEKEKDRSESLLLNILPSEVADELKVKGEAEARQFDNVTILFTDFKGFTSVSEQLSPAELVEELNICFKAFDGIITARGIEKIKTIGDAYMCAGGLPDPHAFSPAEVVMAGLEMQDFMRRYKAQRDAQGRPAFEMRVGIHTGPVVAGIVGLKKFQYDIWGDTVNTASRMESSGEAGHVNISEATYSLIKGATSPQGAPLFHFTARGKVKAKGKGEMEMFFVRRSAEGE